MRWQMSRRQVLLPDLGLGDRPVVAGLWLAVPGDRVEQGAQLLEVSADSVVIDIPAPAGGILVEVLVSEDEPIETGRLLAVIETGEDDC
jgi:2-oxoglutarate dehydrogenase E2 component (dihydrolipoamide succinyltransferase)